MPIEAATNEKYPV